MDTTDLVACVIVTLILLKVLTNCQRDSLITRPDHATRETMAADVLKNKRIFNSAVDVSDIRHRMPWMDAVIYEDIRKLSQTGKFEKKNIYDVLG